MSRIFRSAMNNASPATRAFFTAFLTFLMGFNLITTAIASGSAHDRFGDSGVSPIDHISGIMGLFLLLVSTWIFYVRVLGKVKTETRRNFSDALAYFVWIIWAPFKATYQAWRKGPFHYLPKEDRGRWMA